MRFAIARRGRAASYARSSVAPAAGTTTIVSIVAATIATRPTPVRCHFARSVHLIPKMVNCAHLFRRHFRSEVATAFRTRTVRPSKTASACEPGGSAATMIRGPVARSPFSHQPVPRIAPAAAQRGWRAAFRSISARVPRHHLTEADRKRGRRGALAAERRDADARPTGSANRRSASAGSAATRRGTTVDRTASAAPASVSGSTPRTDPAIRTKIGCSPRASDMRGDREGAVLAPDLAGAVARAGFGPTLEARELQHALTSAIADRRGCCSDFRAPFPPRSWATTATRTASVR